MKEALGRFEKAMTREPGDLPGQPLFFLCGRHGNNVILGFVYASIV